MVKRLADDLGIPMPALYIAEDDALNAGAFGAGDRSFVIFTRGLLAELDERELIAVTAHELAHVANRDTRVSGVSRNLLGWAIVVCGAVAVLAVLIVGLGTAVADGDDSGFGWVFVIGCVVTAAVVFVFGMLWFALALLAENPPARPRLSPQELHTLQLYAGGMPLKSVARRLAISEGAVKSYVDRIREKYQKVGRAAPTKIELYQRAVEDGYLPRV